MWHSLVAGLVVFLGGFAIMVLEIVGVRFLAPDFGSSFYVWTSQIGVILMSLAAGYVLGGALADRFLNGRFLTFLLIPAALFVGFTPAFAHHILEAVVSRHPLNQPVPILWQKLDPAIGSALIFLLPCMALATLPPAMIRLSSHRLGRVGRVSGLVYACSTAGSILGVFVSGYVLIDLLPLSTIFQGTGVLLAALAVLCWRMDRLRIDGKGAEG